ncbi:extracellular solute-binding protein [Gracilibacillus salitolerans]|uniref:Extracellular solute-binding protein n=1 Tax=Gracilibacillus salitolerans TaxID=2663022 RepID=A0A5Q2TMA8_9BACI|nr:extracellular solute-binding protein [Gracilibacillus salitolerans]QGH35906.1 extracellular solute-binding protein [Gracilibacillus salitolerans]
MKSHSIASGKLKGSLIGGICLLLVLLVGCAENTNGDGKETISVMANVHTPQVATDSSVLDQIEEKAGVELDITWVPDETYDDKMNTVIATQSYPRAMFVKNSDSYTTMKDSLTDEVYWEIGPYLDDYENLSNLDPVVLNNTAVNGKIFALYRETPLSRWGIMYRKDWAENLGIDEPQTTEDLYEMFRAFTEEDPDGNGQDDTFGVAVNSDLVYGGFKFVSSYFGTPNNWGEKDGELVPEFMFPEYIETMDFFKKLRDAGYVNKDFPVTSKTNQTEMLTSGKAGAIVGCLCNAAGFQENLQIAHPDGKLDVQNRISTPDGEPGTWSTAGYGSVMLIPKASNETEEEVREVLSLFDKLMDPEIYNALVYGIEEEHYKLVDGNAKRLEGEEVDASFEKEVRPLLGLAIGGDTTIDALQPHFANNLDEKQYNQTLDNNNILIHDPTVALNSETYGEKGMYLQQIIDDATIQYILGEIDINGFESAVEKWRAEGGDQITEEYNEGYQNIQ